MQRENNFPHWLDLLILILFFICCGCPSSWSKQQVAKTSNTWSLDSSVLWTNATKAANIHVSLNTIWQCLSWSPTHSWTENLHICDRVDTGCWLDDISIPYKTLECRAAVTSCIPIFVQFKSWMCYNQTACIQDKVVCFMGPHLGCQLFDWVLCWSSKHLLLASGSRLWSVSRS